MCVNALTAIYITDVIGIIGMIEGESKEKRDLDGDLRITLQGKYY